MADHLFRGSSHLFFAPSDGHLVNRVNVTGGNPFDPANPRYGSGSVNAAEWGRRRCVDMPAYEWDVKYATSREFTQAQNNGDFASRYPIREMTSSYWTEPVNTHYGDLVPTREELLAAFRECFDNGVWETDSGSWALREFDPCGSFTNSRSRGMYRSGRYNIGAWAKLGFAYQVGFMAFKTPNVTGATSIVGIEFKGSDDSGYAPCSSVTTKNPYVACLATNGPEDLLPDSGTAADVYPAYTEEYPDSKFGPFLPTSFAEIEALPRATYNWPSNFQKPQLQSPIPYAKWLICFFVYPMANLLHEGTDSFSDWFYGMRCTFTLA